MKTTVAIGISAVLATALILVISSICEMALAKVNLTPSGGTAGGQSLKKAGLIGNGGAGGLETHTVTGGSINGGGGSGGGGSGGGSGGRALCSGEGCIPIPIHGGGGSGGKP